MIEMHLYSFLKKIICIPIVYCLLLLWSDSFQFNCRQVYEEGSIMILLYIIIYKILRILLYYVLLIYSR